MLMFRAATVTPSVIARSVATRQSSRFKSVAVGDNRSACRHLDCRDACGRLAMTGFWKHAVATAMTKHDRFPMAVMCYVYLLPKRTIKVGKKEEVNLERAEKLFERIAGRTDWRETKDKYEHFALLKVDFESDPPSLIETTPLLSIDGFFDKILQTYKDRKPL